MFSVALEIILPDPTHSLFLPSITLDCCVYWGERKANPVSYDKIPKEKKAKRYSTEVSFTDWPRMVIQSHVISKSRQV